MQMQMRFYKTIDKENNENVAGCITCTVFEAYSKSQFLLVVYNTWEGDHNTAYCSERYNVAMP